MKHVRKLACLLLALVMIFALATTALAEDTNPGQITINETVDGKTYDLFRVFDLTYVGEDPNQKVAYTINTNWADFFTGAGAGYIVDTNTGNLNPITVDGATDYKYINITDANVADFAQAALAYAAAKTADTTITATGTTTVVTNLPLGYYLVYPVGAGEIKETYASLCSLTSTVPNGTVTVKATYPTIEKEDDAVSADVGRTVTYTINGEVPDTTGYTTYTYTIKDTMSEGLTFNKDVKVTIGETVIDETTLAGWVNYPENVNGFELTIPVKNYTAGAAIVVEYTATVNDKAVIVISKNKAELVYSNDPADGESKETTPPVEEEVYSSKIVIDKYDAGDETKETKLEGAKFILYKKVEGVNQYYKYTAATDTLPAKVEWVTDKDQATVVTTNDNGVASFDGLADGTYYLEETKAPNGYNLLPEPVKIVVDGSAATADDLTALTNTQEVANQSGAELPSTGGIGTTIFYVLGSVLVLGAVVLLVTKKRMSSNG